MKERSCKNAAQELLGHSPRAAEFGRMIAPHGTGIP
jgi:hypothetical protein